MLKPFGHPGSQHRSSSFNTIERMSKQMLKTFARAFSLAHLNGRLCLLATSLSGSSSFLPGNEVTLYVHQKQRIVPNTNFTLALTANGTLYDVWEKKKRTTLSAFFFFTFLALVLNKKNIFYLPRYRNNGI